MFSVSVLLAATLWSHRTGAPPDGLKICATCAPYVVPVRSIDDMSELGQWLLLSMFNYILSYDYTHVYVFVYASMNLHGACVDACLFLGICYSLITKD